MQAFVGVGEILALLLLLAIAITYVAGWRRMRSAMPGLATPLRLLAFFIACFALTVALVWPLPGWSNYLLAMRSLQKIAICMVAVPLLWLSIPIHIMVWGQRGWTRRLFVRFHRSGWAHSLVYHITNPLVTWFIFIAAFLFWHDAKLVPYLLGDTLAHTLAPWVLLGAAILFWWPIVETSPRLHRHFPAWLLIIYLFSVEIANMVAGITIAFTAEPLYPHYPAQRALLPPDALPWSQSTDQIAGGAIVWVFGSLVYISSIVFVLFSLFRKEGSTTPEPFPNWDDDAKFIAPGLEHRVSQNKLRNVDLHHH